MLRLLLLLACLTMVTSAGPPADGGVNISRACHKGQTNLLPFSLSDDFPRHYLNWGYDKPEFVEWFIDYPRWEKEYRSYFKRHYNETSLTFKPSMIVMHYTVVPTAEATWSLFQRNHVSVQLMIARDGTVYQLMPLNRRCTGAYGVNHKALSIEMVARTEGDLLDRANQVYSSFCLVKYLMAEYDIPLKNVVAHSEVGEGVTRVPQYLDLADPYYPTRYPPRSKRTDPGKTYMRWLRTYLQLLPPSKDDLY